MRRPDFFILGAPKCGTTALSEYLREHPRVFVSRPKEPHYFGSDFDYYYAPGRREPGHYLQLFAAADERHLAVGEASVWYLYSRRAAGEIRAFAPGARVIAMVRNPVELVPSLHSQLLYTLDEDEPDPLVAWRLQDERAAGRRIPATCRVPEFLQYGEAARLGAQVRRLYEVFPPEQVKVIVFDDLRADAAAVYRETLDFLRVPDDGRTEFGPVNQNKQHRAGLVARVTQRPPRALVRGAEGLKRLTGVERLGILGRIRAHNRLVRPRGEVTPELIDELAEHFREDAAELGALIGRDLGSWTAPAAGPVRS